MPDPNAIARRLVQEAHNRDGVPEIAVGLSFLLAASLIHAQVVLPRESGGFKAAVIAFALLLPLLIFGTPGALRWLRARYLIERFGYVQYRPIGRKQIGSGIVLAVLVALTLFGAVPRLSHPDRWLLAGPGCLAAPLRLGAAGCPGSSSEA